MTAIGRALQFDFAFERRLRPVAALFGVTPRTARVELDDLHLRVRFGLWRLLTPVANIAAARRTGPYAWWKVAGPPHLSFADRGVTFATTTRGGVCLELHQPVPALLPVGWVRHPGVTLTVADPDGLLGSLPRGIATD